MSWRGPNDDLMAGAFDDPSGLRRPVGSYGDDHEWGADQRFVHGLLRAMHSADAQGREARVDAILNRIEVEPRVRHRWALVAAGGLILAALAWPLFVQDRLPEAKAAVLRGAALLADGSDRRFVVETASLDGQGKEQGAQTFELLARPGMHFVISGAMQLGPIHFADMRFGCDGKQFWFHSHGSSSGPEDVRRSGPLDEAPAMLRGIGNVLDLGLLDVHRVVQQLPQDFVLQSDGREVDENGRTLVLVRATGGPHRPGFHLHAAELWCDEDTGMIERLVVEADDGLGRVQRLTFRHQGVVAVDTTIYDRPW